MLLAMLTFGLATPFVLNMTLGYFINNLKIQGSINFEQILQGANDQGGSMSDAALDMLDEGLMDIA